MDDSPTAAEGGANASLSIDGSPVAAAPTVGAHTDASGAVPTDVCGRFCAVVDVTDGNLHQIEMALQANRHGHDPHPTIGGAHVQRHPVYLTGAPAELDLATIRALYATRFDYVSPEAPPTDGSHIDF